MGSARIVALMNKKAASVGMRQTSFADPAGISDGNRASAEDLFMLTKYLYNNRSFILRMTSGRLGASAYDNPRFSNLGNFNLFSKDARFVGGKVGKTPGAGETFAGIFNLRVRNYEDEEASESVTTRPVAVIILGANDQMKDDIDSVLAWIEARYGKPTTPAQ